MMVGSQEIVGGKTEALEKVMIFLPASGLNREGGMM
jgi:hypothetical protein